MDEPKIAREVKLEQDELYRELVNKRKLESEFGEKSKEKERIERKLKVLANRDKKIQDKINPMLKELVEKVETEEDEDISAVFPEDGKVVVQVTDRIKQLRKMRREEKARKPEW